MTQGCACTIGAMPNDAASLLAAVRDRDVVAVERLLDAGVLADVTDEDGNTVLGLAAANADAEMCEGGFTPGGRHGFVWLCGECQGS